jgi:outer membrane protein assembly factor BamB
MSAHRRCIPALLVCLIASPCLARHWPRFRGPGGDGVAEADIPAKWEPTDINWKVALPGVGHASAVGWGDKVFTTCGDERSGAQSVVCVNAPDGAILWKRDYPCEPYRHHGENSYASSTPAVDGDHVYVLLMQPRELKVVALKHDGADAWNASLGPFVTQHGGGTSPVVHGDMVIVANEQDGPGSSLVALDRQSGAVKWKTPRRSYRFSASTPCVFRPKEGPEQLVFTSWAHGMTGINPADGSVVWEAPGAFDARTVGSPVAANDAGLVVGACGEGGRGNYLIAIRPPTSPGGKAEVAYKIPKNAPYVPTPVVKGDRLFFVADGGIATCANATTGETIWQERVPGGAFFGSPVISGDKLFALSKRGNLIALSATDQFKLLANNELGDKSDATPAISNGRMYVRTYGHLLSVGGKN